MLMRHVDFSVINMQYLNIQWVFKVFNQIFLQVEFISFLI